MESRNSKNTLGSWKHVVDVLQTHYHEPDIEAARVLYSAVGAHALKGQPVWPMAIAPPGSMKSELLIALDGLPGVHLIDSVTAKTFISGQIIEPGKKSRPASLLHRIGKNGIIVCPDLSTVLAMKGDERNAVMADLRKIYDGKLVKEFGTTEEVPAWEGRITLIAAVTPAYDKHLPVIQELGERFVLVRWHRAGPDAARRAMRQDTELARSELKAAVHDLIQSLSRREPEVPTEVEDRLIDLAELVVRARTHVDRDRDKAIVAIPEAESPTRLAQQLTQLAKGSATLSGRQIVSAEDFRLVKRVGFDCIPPLRRLVLDGLMTDGQINIPASTKHYAMEDLECLGLIDRDGKGNRLSALAEELLDQIEHDPADIAPECFTQAPPLANEGTGRGGGGTLSEGHSEGAAQ